MPERDGSMQAVGGEGMFARTTTTETGPRPWIATLVCPHGALVLRPRRTRRIKTAAPEPAQTHRTKSPLYLDLSTPNCAALLFLTRARLVAYMLAYQCYTA